MFGMIAGTKMLDGMGFSAVVGTTTTEFSTLDQYGEPPTIFHTSIDIM
jgi:hypothetical protein